MNASAPSVTYVGGPTAVLHWDVLRILTDPAFDSAPTADAAAALGHCAGLFERLRRPVTGEPIAIG
jgi:L-ascorbate metabolism protein UlaG (beta-lactamase superfamily)